MNWAVFRETLRRERRGITLWALALLGYGFITPVIIPDQEGMQQLIGVFESLPVFLWQMLGIEDISVALTPAGFIALRYFLFATVLAAVWAITAGLNVTANEEASGISNMLLSLPLSRGRVVVEKVLAYALLTVVLPLSGFAGLLLAMQVNPNAQTEVRSLLDATLAIIPVMLLVLTLTALIATVVPRRGLAGALAGGFVAASFIVNSVGTMIQSSFGDALKQFSIFHHANALETMRDGFPLIPAVALVTAAVVFTVVSVQMFARRDLSV